MALVAGSACSPSSKQYPTSQVGPQAQENQALPYYIQVKENETVWTFLREPYPWWQRKEDTQIQFEEFQDNYDTAIQQYNIYSMMK